MNILKWNQLLYIWNRGFQKWGTEILKNTKAWDMKTLVLIPILPLTGQPCLLNHSKGNLKNSYIPSDSKICFYFAKENKDWEDNFQQYDSNL